MKKISVLLLALTAAAGTMFAQSTPTSVSYNKLSEPGLMLNLPYTESVSEDFIVSNLKKTGYDPETKGKLFWKQNKVDGFYTFKGVRLEGDSEVLDLYFKVESRSRHSKDGSVIYLLVGKNDGSFANTTTDDPAYVAAKNFLNGFVDQASAYKLDLDIKDQEELVKKEEKKLSKLQDNEKDMNKKIDDLQNDLKKNRNDQDSQQKTIETERAKLATLKTQVKA